MSCGDPWRSIRCSASLGDLDLLRLLGGMRMLGAGVHFQLPVHRIAHLGLRQHAADRFLHETNRLALADVDRALFTQAALETAMPAVQLLTFFLSGQLDGR